MNSDLDQPLAHLETIELIRRLKELLGASDDVAYQIRHALVQETAYSSLLKQERRRLHQLIGETIEETYPDAVIENASLLARHFGEAGDDAKILQYGECAGDAEERVFAKEEAIAHYRAALAAALRLRMPRERIVTLVSKLGRLYELQNKYNEALETYALLLELADKAHDPAYELAGRMLQATLRATPTPVFDAQAGQELTDRALELAQELNDGAAQAKIFWNLLLLNGFTGRYRAAVEYGERSLALARALQLESQIAYTLNDLGNYGYFATGQLEKSREALTQARALWRKLDNPPMLADNLNNSGVLEYMRGDYALSRQFSDEALALSERTDNSWGIVLAHTFRGCVAREAGDYGAALRELRPALTLARKTKAGIEVLAGTNLALVYAAVGDVEAGYDAIQAARGELGIGLYRAASKAALAYLTWLRGESERAHELLQEARPHSPDDLQFSYLPSIVAEGEMGLAAGDPERVVAYTEIVVARLREFGLGSDLADAGLYLGRARVHMGYYPQAREAYERAYTDAVNVGSRRAQWQIGLHWAELERAQGNHVRAQELQAEAENIIAAIAATLEEPYRSGFLQNARITP